MGEGNIFSLSTLAGGVPHPRSVSGGEVPHPRSGWGNTPSQGLGGGYPIPGLDGGGYPGYPTTRSGWWGGTWVPSTRSAWWGVPRVSPDQVWMVGGYPQYPLPPGLDGVPPSPIRQSSIASTCYAAGGVPLAFT